ncbi:MAG: hypothetical protein JWP35_2642 [Caulobacter sp.]|jgi:hypothetical protein|nr:hypothetical protein [Caulobacter sp.]
MTPPWITNPDIERGSIGWRMGAGEETYNAFYRAFSVLTDADATAFARVYPEPPEWAGFYAMIRENPWR